MGDVHCHLIHDAFPGAAADSAVTRARAAGLSHIIVNGLEPTSNRAVLEFCSKHPDVLRPALGLYPLNACVEAADPHDFHARFGFEKPSTPDISAELDFIDSQARMGNITAIGETGMDGIYGYTESLLLAQEAVLRELCKLAKKHCLPIIVHSRGAEQRVFDVLQDEGVQLADFHCFMGKKRLGVEFAKAGYFLSIPSFVHRNTQLQALCQVLPLEQLLTETDSPYLSPEKGAWPNEPSTVPLGVAAMARACGKPEAEVRAQICSNYEMLFKS